LLQAFEESAAWVPLASLYDYVLVSGVQRSGDARGNYLIGCPLPNSSIEEWRMVVIVTEYTLFVTSWYDVIFTFANQRFGEVCGHNVHIQGPRGSCRSGRAV